MHAAFGLSSLPAHTKKSLSAYWHQDGTPNPAWQSIRHSWGPPKSDGQLAYGNLWQNKAHALPSPGEPPAPPEPETAPQPPLPLMPAVPPNVPPYAPTPATPAEPPGNVPPPVNPPYEPPYEPPYPP